MENGVLTVILERTIECKLKTKGDHTITTQLSFFAFGTALFLCLDMLQPTDVRNDIPQHKCSGSQLAITSTIST